MSLTRCGTFHLPLSQGSIKVVRFFYSELLTRRILINFRLLKNSLVDKEASSYCLTAKSLLMQNFKA